MSSVVVERALYASLIGGIVAEREGYEQAVREEIELRLQRLAEKLLDKLVERFLRKPPRDAREAVKQAEKLLEEYMRSEEVEEVKQLLDYVDVDAFLEEQLHIFNVHVDEIYESVYKRYTSFSELAEVEPILLTLTSVKIMYNVSLENENSLAILRKGTALLLALAALVKQKRLDLVKQLPGVAEDILANHVLRGRREV